MFVAGFVLMGLLSIWSAVARGLFALLMLVYGAALIMAGIQVFQKSRNLRHLVGVPIAIGARLFAQGKITQTGVFPPEMLDPKPFVDMLPEYGMNCIEKKL